jgi:hypothetical protein
MSEKNASKEVLEWNNSVKIGDLVDYYAYPGAKPERYATRTQAKVLNEHTAVVWLTGKAGCVSVASCKKVEVISGDL